jgi:hypothetical protein
VADVADPAGHQSAVGKWRLGSSAEIPQAQRRGAPPLKAEIGGVTDAQASERIAQGC